MMQTIGGLRHVDCNPYRRSMAYTHGTHYGYFGRRCRCDACRDWWAAWIRDYRKRRMAKTGERMKNGRFVKPDE